jgi:hypothetical protein
MVVRHCRHFGLDAVLAVVLLVSTAFGIMSVSAGTPTPVGQSGHHSVLGGSAVDAGGRTVVNCAQGARTITVKPTTPLLSVVLLTDYNTLGLLGGGTIRLDSGTYTLTSTLVFRSFSDVTIEGSGTGQTFLSMPVNPVGHFRSTTGQELGRWDYARDRAVDGGVADLLRVDGPKPINNFEMCDLTLRANANSAKEDWDGSLLFDSSGGHHHVYENLRLNGFYGPSTIPNGIHLEDFSSHSKAYGYVVDDLEANHNRQPFDHSRSVVGGPNFLNVGGIVGCKIENVRAIGLLAFEQSPPKGCEIDHVHISGHLGIDPLVGGSWGGTLFEHLTVDSRNTAAPNAMALSVANGSAHGSSTFSDLRWNHDTFYGTVLHAANMVSVVNSRFYGGLNETAANFVHNYDDLTDWSQNRVDLPVQIDGSPTGGHSSKVTFSTFVFPHSTYRLDPFVLRVTTNSWRNDVVEIAGKSPGYLLLAPRVHLARDSVFASLTYQSRGDGSPASLKLVNLPGSPGFRDLGASVKQLHRIRDNLHKASAGPVDRLITDRGSSHAIRASPDRAPIQVPIPSSSAAPVGPAVAPWSSHGHEAAFSADRSPPGARGNGGQLTMSRLSDPIFATYTNVSTGS